MTCKWHVLRQSVKSRHKETRRRLYTCRKATELTQCPAKWSQNQTTSPEINIASLWSLPSVGIHILCWKGYSSVETQLNPHHLDSSWATSNWACNCVSLTLFHGCHYDHALLSWNIYSFLENPQFLQTFTNKKNQFTYNVQL